MNNSLIDTWSSHCAQTPPQSHHFLRLASPQAASLNHPACCILLNDFHDWTGGLLFLSYNRLHGSAFSGVLGKQPCTSDRAEGVLYALHSRVLLLLRALVWRYSTEDHYAIGSQAALHQYSAVVPEHNVKDSGCIQTCTAGERLEVLLRCSDGHPMTTDIRYK